MPIIQDEEFGKITVRRSPRATQVKIRVAPDGKLRASLPLYAPIFLVKRLIKSSRDELRTMLGDAGPFAVFIDGMLIGKSHHLTVRSVKTGKPSADLHKQQIIVTLPDGSELGDPSVNRIVRDVVISALRIEAKSYLPRRLSFLAEKFGFSYQKVRFSHSSGRWGSCSSSGTISLNIALMKLPFELIDYVIIHELSHTKYMNHSQDFWQQVMIGDPSYKLHRRLLKSENPTI